MPIGVMIFNTRQQAVEFENQKLDDLFRSDLLASKYQSKIKSKSAENEEAGQATY